MKLTVTLFLLALPLSLLAQKNTIETCDCPFDRSKIEAKEIWCGKLPVPENYKDPEGPQLKIAFTVIKPENATDDPVVLLPGGPGIGPLSTAYVRIIKNWVPANRTFVVFDPRGTGLSDPEMCPELNETYASISALDLTFEEAQKMRLGADMACRDRLIRAGIDLAQYSNDNIARDVHALMQALGYQQYNLLGGSAGVPMVRSAMRLFPGNVRCAVFNNGPGIDLRHMFTYDVPNAERAFQHIVTLCAADPECNSRYPDLNSSFLRVYNTLKKEPLTVAVDRKAFRSPLFTINSQDFIVMLERWLVREPLAKHLPAILRAFEERNATVIRAMVENHYGGLQSSFSIGMGNAVLCNGSYTTDARPNWEEAAQKSEEAFREMNYWLLPCEQWIQNYDPEETRKPFKSSIPSLVLTGEYDPTTTVRETKSHIPYFSNFQYFTIPGMAHGPPSARESGCWIALIRQFIANPNQQLDAACLKDITPARAALDLPPWAGN